jgi:hypothetical protein
VKKFLLFAAVVLAQPSCDSTVSPPSIPPPATWRPLNTVPVTEDLAAVWGSGPRDVFAVSCCRPDILHFDGNSWALTTVPSCWGFDDVWGTSSHNVYAVGWSTYHYDGSDWKQLGFVTPGHDWVLAVWGSSASDVYFAGAGGLLVHFGGTDFTRVDLNTGQHLIDVWCSGPDDVYVLGTDLLYHFDGASWDSVAVADPNGPPRYNCITGYSRDNVFMSGLQSAMFDGNNWRTVPHDLPYLVEDIWCAGRDDYYAAAGRRMYRYDGRTWREQFQLPTSRGASWLTGVWGDSYGTLYGAADQGGVWNYRNEQPRIVNGNASPITAVWAGNPMEVYVGTEAGAVFHVEGGRLRDTGLEIVGRIRSLWGPEADRLYAADGRDLHRYNGLRWDEVDLPADILAEDVWESSRRTLFVVGRGGLAKRDERDWTAFESPVGGRTVWGRNAEDVFAASGEALFHHDGENWSVVTHDMGSINDLWGLPSGHIYAAAWTGLYVHFQGEWSRVPATPGSDVETVWGTSPDALYFLDCGCASASVYFNDGLESEEVYRSDEKMLRALWGTSVNDVYVGGMNGLLVHYGW